MQALGRLSHTNGCMHGHQREVLEDDVRVFNEDELRVFGENEVNVASVTKVRKSMNVDFMNVGNGLVNDNGRMNVNNNARMVWIIICVC